MDKNIKNTIQNKQTTTESGRSMVEMLGVLAVVGFLSVGGIVGYTHAMNKYHANEIVSEVSMMAVTASQGLLLNGDFTLDEYGDEVAGYSYDYNVDFGGTEDRFSITVQGVEDGVCENIKNMNFSALNQILVNGTADGDCTDPSDVEFVFYDDFGDSYEGENGEGEGEQHLSCNEERCMTCPAGKEISCKDDFSDCACATNPEDPDSWACYYMDSGKKNCIECPEGQKVVFDYGKGYCVDSEVNAKVCYGEICECSEDETPVCVKDGCACAKENETVECNHRGCIVCPEGETPKCPATIGNEIGCACIPHVEDETTWTCRRRACIGCQKGETPMCPEYGDGEEACTCIKAGEEWTCSINYCLSCPEGFTPQGVPGWGNTPFVCVDKTKPDSWACGGSECISCNEGEKPLCGSTCVCVPDGVSAACNRGNCITCPVGKKAVCGDDADLEYSLNCSCIDESSSSWACSEEKCIGCPEGKIAHCDGYSCVCLSEEAKENEDWACSGYSCIVCPEGKTAKCPEWGGYENACVCLSEGAKENEDWACNDNVCIECPEGKKAMCSDYGDDESACVCISANAVKGEDWNCSESNCVTCSNGTIAICGDYTCKCIIDTGNEDSWACSSEECIECPEGKIPKCSDWGNCICISKDSEEGRDFLCAPDMCVSCTNGKKPVCADDYDGYDTCICVTDIDDEDSWECNSADCIDCPGGYARCPSNYGGYGDCYCT